MKSDRTESLIASLQRDLQPVRPVPRLRTHLGVFLAAVVLLAGFVMALLAPRPDALTLLGQIGPFAAIGGGLAMATLGAALASLASARPGREWVALTASFAASATLAVSAGAAALMLFDAAPATSMPEPAGQDLHCALIAIALAVPPALLLARLAGAAAPQRPGWTGLLAALGATTLGALAVHLTCATPDRWHWLTSHALAPVAGAALLALPLAWLLRHRPFARSV